MLDVLVGNPNMLRGELQRTKITLTVFILVEIIIIIIYVYFGSLLCVWTLCTCHSLLLMISIMNITRVEELFLPSHFLWVLAITGVNLTRHWTNILSFYSATDTFYYLREPRPHRKKLRREKEISVYSDLHVFHHFSRKMKALIFHD